MLYKRGEPVQIFSQMHPTRILLLFLAVLTCPAAFLPMVAESQEPEKPVVLGYFLTGEGVTPDQINYGLYTHLCIAFAGIGKRGKIELPSDPAVPEILARAHGAGVKVLLSFGGADSGAVLNELSLHQSERRAAAKQLATELIQSGYDGCDVDWEFPGKKNVPGFLDFVRTLAAEMRSVKPDAVLTLATPATDYYGQYYPLGQIASDISFIQVMSYDLHGPWKDGEHFSHSGHNSPLHPTNTDTIDGEDLSFDAFVKYWKGKGVPANKINIGIPCYGHGFATTGWGLNPTRASRFPEITYSDVIKLKSQPGWIAGVDTQAGVPFIRNKSLEEIISYDDADSGRLKGEWAQSAGIRGIFFWEISQDFVENHNVVIEAAREGFSSSR